MAKVNPSPTGVPAPPPSAVLEWYGKRIRGLNLELWHDNPDGSIVKGWHDHHWSPQEQDSYVVSAKPVPNRKGLIEILKWGLQRWNIGIQNEQLELHND
jgi:hypothetical protein